MGRERGGSGGWVDLGRDGGAVPGAGYSIVHTRQIVMHCSVSYLKCCETLSFLVRDVVHITPENFSSCVAAIRTFVEASYRYCCGVWSPFLDMSFAGGRVRLLGSGSHLPGVGSRRLQGTRQGLSGRPGLSQDMVEGKWLIVKKCLL